MFAPGDRDIALKSRITKVIKEWCKGVSGVVNIDFSINDGVVYVKCNSKKTAGAGK